MSDNVTIPTTGTGTATPVIATDDVSGAHYQRLKLDLGGDGLASPLVRGALTAANSIPTTLATDDPAVTALAVLDDWDESDRAKVNPIVGQAGVAAGAGAVDALTQRTVPAQSSGVNTVQTALLALQSVAASSVAVGAAFTLSGTQGAFVYVRFGRRSATAAGAGATIRIEASSSLTVDNSWHPLAQFTTAFAAASDEAVSGTVAAGATAITVAATSGFVAGDVIFIDNGTIGNSEWARIKSISANVSVTVEDALVNAATGATIYDAAEIYPPIWVPKGVLRVRVVDDGSVFTQAHAIQALLSTVDA